jgi:hypothetical protein
MNKIIYQLRLNKPWNYKFPLLLFFCYLPAVVAKNIDFEKFSIGILAAILLMTGFAGIAYMFNDYSDNEVDKLAGKQNMFEDGIQNKHRVTAFIYLIFITLPWYWLPFDEVSLILATVVLLLYFLYAFKPFRLKEKGFLGLLTDATYAHIIPAFFAYYTFVHIVDFRINFFSTTIATLLIWQLISGLRNILSHQIIDFHNDLNTNTTTFTVKYGLQKSKFLLAKIFISLEIISFSVFLLLIELGFLFFIISYVVYCLLVLVRFVKKDYHEKSRIKKFTNLFLDDFYLQILPVLTLIYLTTSDWKYLILVFLQIILFQSPIKKFASKLI